MANLKKIIRKVNGVAFPLSFPANDHQKTQDETVENVLLNALAGYQVKQKKEIFTVMALARKIAEQDRPADAEVKFSAEELQFLSDVLYQATYQVGPKGEAKGVYMPVVIGQVLEELNITE